MGYLDAPNKGGGSSSSYTAVYSWPLTATDVETAGSGSMNAAYGATTLTTSAVPGNYYWAGQDTAGYPYLDITIPWAWSATVAWNAGGSGNQSRFIGAGGPTINSSGVDTFAKNAVGFHINHNGSSSVTIQTVTSSSTNATVTTIDTSSLGLANNKPCRFSIVNDGVSYKFYIQGVLVATHTTNLPASLTYRFKNGVHTSSSTPSSLTIFAQSIATTI